MELIWILFLLQTICIVCPRESNVSKSRRVALINTFGYNFIRVPQVGRVIFWKISKDKQEFRPQKYKEYVTQFDSHETYLLFTQTQEEHVSIYYWLGKNTLLDDKKVAAKYGVMLYTLFMRYMNSRTYWDGEVSMSREVQDMESKSFHMTVNNIERQAYHGYLDSEYISHYPNLYVVRGDTTTRIKKIPMGTLWLISDSCLILESEYTIEEFTPVNMYCGPNVSEKAKRRAHVFLNFLYMLYIRFAPPEPLVILDSTNRNEPKFKLLMEVLEDMRNYKSYEIDKSNDHLKDAATFVEDRDEAVKLFWIKHRTIKAEDTNEIKSVFLMREDKTRPLFTENFNYQRETGIGFLFDSSSIAGLTVHMHRNDDVDFRIAIIDIVEDYIEEKYSSNSIPTRVRIIRESSYRFLVIDFLINMITWPVRNYDLDDIEMVHW